MISSSSSKKVLFVSYVPQLYEPNRYAPRESQQRTSRTAIVVERSSADQVSIQGYAAVPYKDKHKCWSLFQRAVKELLAVPTSLSIYIRFADPPHSAISSLHTVLQVPSHVVNLTVSPLPCSVHTGPPSQSLHTSATDTTTFLQAKDERDPYCRYRDLYQKPPRRSLTGCRSMDGQHGDASRSSSGFVRQKCDFAEMNRLLSQLAEVSLSLQRTKEECDMIAKRCPPKPKERTQIKQKCNGSCIEEVDRAALKEVVRELESEEERAADKKVEELIHMAHSITQGITTGPEQQQTAQAVSPLPAHHSTGNLPDCPSDVFVRPSFSTGSAYVMWNPISLDGNDSNHGYKVFGYLVYVDEQLWAESPGPLSSQVELDGLKHNTEYHIQVCTHAEHNSQLSSPFTYSHTEYRKSNSSTPCHLSVRQTDSRVKAARVESWLKSSQTPLLSLDTHRHSPTDSNLLSPHVHFAKETCTQDLHSHTTDSSTLNGHKQYLLHTGSAGEQESPGTEDTKSITSSHTSGIVTDLPNSPKLSPACGCARCSNTESVDAGIGTLNSCSHRHHHHQREFCHGGHCGSPSLLGSTSTAARSQPCKKTTQSSATSVTSSTLCPSPIPSTASYIPDTVIDEPLDLKDSNPDLKSDTSLATSVRLPSSMKPISGPFARYGLASPHKGPLSPQDVRVVKGRRGSIVISWTPVSRDLKGCSCGFYVLGYRVYVNGAFSQTVDGAMKFETSLKCPLSNVQPPYHRLLIHVRTRSIAAESLPSNTVIYDLMLRRVVEPSERKKPLDSVMSSVDTASLCTKTSASLLSHPVSRASTYPPTNNTHQHLETFV